MIEETIPLDAAMDLVKRVFTEGDPRGHPRHLHMATPTLAETRGRISAPPDDWHSWVRNNRMLSGIPIELDETIAPGMVRVEWP